MGVESQWRTNKDKEEKTVRKWKNHGSRIPVANTFLLENSVVTYKELIIIWEQRYNILIRCCRRGVA